MIRGLFTRLKFGLEFGRTSSVIKYSSVNQSRSKFFISRRSIMSSNSIVPSTSADVINLCKGEPGGFLLEKSINYLKIASQKTLSASDAIELMRYGPDLGGPKFLSVLEQFLTDQYKDTVNKENFVETAGASNGLFLLSSIFFKPDDLVFAEEYSYFLGLKILKEGARLNVQSVRIDSHGIDPDDLDKHIQSHIVSWQQWRPSPHRPYWAMVYLVPQFHNPTGVCLSSERSRKVIDLARKYSLMIVCDDVYSCLYFPSRYDRPPKRLFAFDDPNDPQYGGGHVVSNCSFSKLFAPGVRCGWLEAPERIRTALQNTELNEEV